MKYMGDYFVGLDIGTDSVGWAAADTDYKLLRANQKDLWGVRLFDEAQPAAERRQHRTARRLTARRKQRLQWLRQLFDVPVSQVDPAFFLRMDESKFYAEDKKHPAQTGSYTLFNDRDFTDVDYHKRFPTIWHLRKAILTEADPFDVRLVYLAIHHIIKNRGHFLLDNELETGVQQFDAVLSPLEEYWAEECDNSFSVADPVAFENALKDRTMKITRKRAALKNAAGVAKEDVRLNAVMDLLAGATVKFTALFADTSIDEEELKEMGSITFKKDIEEQVDDWAEKLSEQFELIRLCKAVYDWAVLAEILEGEAYISLAKVCKYEKHKSDLARLKSVIRAKLPEKYREMFHAKDLPNYAAYCKNAEKNCDYEAFFKYTRKLLSTIAPTDEQAEAIIAELEQETFLPLQTTKANSVIPRQVHRVELVRILQRAEGYLPFLAEKDADGRTVSEKILAVFDYRIPYFVGPLNTASPRAWVVRSDEKIYPWNFEQVVDLDQSEERFYLNLTSKCTYLRNEDVLPADSLLYSEFKVRDEISALCVNGKRLSAECKNKIYADLFQRRKKVRYKDLTDYMKSNGWLCEGDVLSGIDTTIKSQLTSYHAFRRILEATGDNDMVEDIIKRIVMSDSDRVRLEKYLTEKYADKLSKADIRYICRQKFSGWGNLSQKFLTGLYHADECTGEAFSVMDLMRTGGFGLAELRADRFGFLRAAKAENRAAAPEAVTVQEMVEKSYASPAVKRGVLQAMGIVDEIVRINGKRPPKRIFVEMARGEDEKKERTVSRKGQLLALYENCKEEERWLLDSLEGAQEGSLRSDRLYLYYTQLGRCMYSGEPIDLKKLHTDYDIDHIYPRSRVKDDSLNNRVLVKRKLNEEKGDTYPIKEEIRRKQRGFWQMLKERGFITAKKFDRLTRSTSFSEEELAGFISRQLVETRQSSKIVAEILQQVYGEQTEVVYVKAGNVSAFRQQADEQNDPRTDDFVKCRELNPLHHAKDAYLNIVVGNVYHVKFTKDPRNFLRSAESRRYSMNRVFDYPVERGSECAWQPGEKGSMAQVRKTIRRNNVLFTRFASEANGQLFEVNLKKAGRQWPAAAKSSDTRMETEKYGGYDALSGAYFCLVEHSKGKKRVRSVEAVYLMHEPYYRVDPVAYCEQILKLSDVRILVPRILYGALFELGGFRMHLTRRFGVQLGYKNATPLLLNNEWHRYVKQVAKYDERCGAMGMALELTDRDGVTAEKNMKLYSTLKEKVQKSPYNVRLKSLHELLQRGMESFEKLTEWDQCKILLQVLRIFSCTAGSGDLRAIGGGKETGGLSTTKNVDAFAKTGIYLIHQSITGVFEQRVDLLAANLHPGRG